VWGCSTEGLAFGCSSTALRHTGSIAACLRKSKWQVDAQTAAAMLSENNSVMAYGIAEGILSAEKQVFSTASGFSRSAAALF